ncbi:hypothetical protein QUF80_14355 [Desulfococcaceae bacterium HSG8]|nr:hypothetical protein [Desulfococcaceae bacterium HSG8]
MVNKTHNRRDSAILSVKKTAQSKLWTRLTELLKSDHKIRYALRITHHASRITFHVSRFTHHASRITHYASRITHHASRSPEASASRFPHHFFQAPLSRLCSPFLTS